MSEIEKKWYVLRAISGKEAKVKEYLEADIKNSDLGDYVSQVLIPTEKVYVMDTTCWTLPLVSPLRQISWRLRLQNTVRPSAMVSASVSAFM